MNSADEAISYGRYVKFLTQLYKDEGIEVLLDFLIHEDDFSSQMTLAYLVQANVDQGVL